MQNIQYFPSITNVQLEIEANTIPELYKAGIVGMANLLKDQSGPTEKKLSITHVIEVKSADKASLLVDFLGRVLVLSQVESAVFCHLSEIVMYNNFVKAKVQGFPVDTFDIDIIHVNSTEREITKSRKNRWETHLSFEHKTSLQFLN